MANENNYWDIYNELLNFEKSKERDDNNTGNNLISALEKCDFKRNYYTEQITNKIRSGTIVNPLCIKRKNKKRKNKKKKSSIIILP